MSDFSRETRWQHLPTAHRGVMCAADRTQEWLLPWWWSRYAEHNAFPVTFCDFGMGEEAVEWCRERGSVIEVPFTPPVVKREEVDPSVVRSLEAYYGSSVWNFRHIWFKKPFALLNTPYERTIWIDLDCEILDSIAPLFEQCSPKAQLGMMREFAWTDLPRFDPAIVYNSGVVVFEHSAPLIEEWARSALTLTHRFSTDDNLLSYLIALSRVEIVELDQKWNWRLPQGFNINAKIIHWLGGGKEFIRKYGGLKPALDEFQQMLIRPSATK